jgi:hypothetical protein
LRLISCGSFSDFTGREGSSLAFEPEVLFGTYIRYDLLRH